MATCDSQTLMNAAYAAGYGKLSVRNLKEVIVAGACQRSGSVCPSTTLINNLYASGYAKMSTRDIGESDVSAACAGVGGGGQCSATSLEVTNYANGYAKLATGELIKALVATSCANTGPPPVQNPAFGAEIQRWSEVNAAATTVVTLTGAIAQNNTVVLTAFAQNTAMTISGITDSRGNSYTVRITAQGTAGDNMSFSIATALAATALQIGDTITITWNNPISTNRLGAVDFFKNVTSMDTTGAMTGTAAGAISAPAVCAANSVQFGSLWLHDGTTVYSGSNWTIIGTGHVFNGITLYYVEQVTAAGGSQDPGGSINAITDWHIQWISMK